MFKRIISAIIIAIILYFVVSFGWSLLHMQSCSMTNGNKKDWSCEQIAKNNSENCHYVIMRWKKIDYKNELDNCNAWEQNQK